MTIKSTRSKFYIGSTAANGSTDTYVRIGAVVAAGNAMGLQWATVDGTTFDDEYRQNLKTMKDGGDLPIRFHRNYADAGQTALKAAAEDDSDDTYNFKIEIGGTPDKVRTFKCRVLSFRDGLNNPSALFDAEAQIDIVSAMTDANPA